MAAPFTNSKLNRARPRASLSGRGPVERAEGFDQGAARRFIAASSCAAGLTMWKADDVPYISPAAILMVSANTALLKKNARMECISETRRISFEVISTSAVCEATPMMKEK
jgi:hypothetical protein